MTLHEFLSARVERGELPGAVTLVAREDDVRVDAVGSTAFGAGVPLTRDTVFRIASLTKPVLAAAAMLLVEDDVIDLEEPVHRLLPELAGQRVLARIDGPLTGTVPLTRPVTVEDLLTFRMGTGTITEPSVNPPFPIVAALDEQQLAVNVPYPRTPWEPDEWLRRFATLPLMTQPGEKWQYNTAYEVLSVLLARAARQPLGEVLRERLFDPLGMRRTGFSAEGLPVQYAGGAARDDGEIWTRDPVFPSGAGGLVSTVDEFHTFARMLLNRGVHGGTRLLSEQAVELMTTNRLTPAQVAAGDAILPAGTGWGFGVAVDPTGSGGEYGWSGGAGTHWFNSPREHLTAILFTQVSDVLWDGTTAEFRKLAYS
ncbi:serine hydrolase [Actinoplanes sp. N902-109]|uniref:serine hydrolase domain-containing protein n=1 Tax=Actinoplanes sp. (strain N902-109) TaxID=649831 RepID=UPI001E3D8C10|nr:serine hydrolase domain-containing protein [Actinoplanes sp. N902-109]